MIGGFMYTLDVHDRVKSAGGMVNLATVPRPPLAEAVDQSVAQSTDSAIAAAAASLCEFVHATSQQTPFSSILRAHALKTAVPHLFIPLP